MLLPLHCPVAPTTSDSMSVSSTWLQTDAYSETYVGVQPARPRYVLLMLWMSLNGAGLVSSQTIMASARRVRVT